MPSLAEVKDHGYACDIIRGSSSGAVTIVQGWNSSFFNLTSGDLGEEKPVIVLNLSLHGMIMNRPAEEYLSRSYSDIARNCNDRSWTEKNIPLIFRMISDLASPSAEDIRSFGNSLIETGIRAMEDMLLPDSHWLELISHSPVAVDFWADEEVFAALAPPEQEKVKGVKLFTDGALGTKTAALSAQYLSGEKGILIMNEDNIIEKFHYYMKQGVPVAVHAIGDLAVDQVVKTVGILRRERGCSGPVRLEHAQFITGYAAFTAKDAGITLSMQPNFSTDSLMYADRLPEGYAAQNNPFRMLIDKAGFVPGRDMLFGSDGMPHGIKSALQSALFPPFSGQVLSLQEFIDGYCLPGTENEWFVQVENDSVAVFPL